MAVRRADGHGLAAAKGIEIPEVVLLSGGVVLLVDAEEDRLVGLSDNAGDFLVLIGDAGGAIDDEDDDIGLLRGKNGLLANAGCKDVLRLDGLDAAGIDDHKIAAVPVGLVVAAVARDAAGLVDNGVAGKRDAVDERGLADVRAADNCDDGLAHECS